MTFTTFLPFALVSHMGWWAVPGMFALTFLLLGIENIGAQIENRERTNLPLDSRRACSALGFAGPA